ncbi:MAG: DUF1176 domain-containing protein [Bdellovibrio sp.]|nr:DUF1176 domain-containing protein [Bdellovibrio sp.]
MKSILLATTVLFTGFFAVAADPMQGLPASVALLHSALYGANICSKDLPVGSEIYELGKGKKLYLVPCVMGAYQGSTNAFITENDDQIAVPLMVLAFDEVINGIAPTLELTEASYDEKKMLLYSSAKGRGLGDCGQSSISKIELSEYGTVGVKTVEVRSKSKCDGKLSGWPIVFKQK